MSADRLMLATRSDSGSSVRAYASLTTGADLGSIARRYLAASERPAWAAMAEPRRVAWLLGRVAAKAAVARHLAGQNPSELDPIRILIDNDRHGCPIVGVAGTGSATRGLRVSIAHKPSAAVALAATLPEPSPAPGGVGIDIEAVDVRSTTFERTVLSAAERSLRRGEEDRDVWLTRLWTVKEAAAKATGLGLRGRPRDFEIDGVAGAAFRCRRRWIRTESVVSERGSFVVAWTETPVAGSW
jgi:phosphopantetheinyl transferase (holo-ACP synthase)